MLNIRALDLVENKSHPWEEFNTIIGEYTSVMDDLFNRGVRTDLDTYVLHEKEFEYQFCRTQLDPVRRTRLHRIHVLKGKIGRGKSTFVDYCRKVVIPKLFTNTVLQIFVDLQAFNDSKPIESLNNRIIEELEEQLKDILFGGNLFNLHKKYAEFVGYKIRRTIDLHAFYKNSISIRSILQFIAWLLSSNLLSIDGLLIILDNVDENPSKLIKKIDIAIKDIIKIANNEISNFSLTILVTVRNYNAKSFTFTDKNSNTDLRNTNEFKVVYNKIIELKKKLVNFGNYPSIADTFSYFVRIDNLRELRQKVILVHSKEVQNFLGSFAEILFNSKDHKTKYLLSKLSAGNLKVLVGNVFNILHSNKLPLSAIFRKHFLPIDAILSDEFKEEPFTEDVVLECLLAIHFPFYSSGESYIMNLFNCNSSYKKYDYFDQLILSKILLAAKNLKIFTIKQMCEILSRFNYDEKLTLRGLSKCFDYGIFDADNGVKLSHLDKERCKISLSSIGEIYIENLLNNIIYFQYVCEDTYLPENYYISILDKYPHNNFHGNRDARINSGINLCYYIMELLDIERKQLEKNYKDLDYFDEVFGYQTVSKNVSLHIILDVVSSKAKSLMKI